MFGFIISIFCDYFGSQIMFIWSKSKSWDFFGSLDSPVLFCLQVWVYQFCFIKTIGFQHFCLIWTFGLNSMVYFAGLGSPVLFCKNIWVLQFVLVCRFGLTSFICAWTFGFISLVLYGRLGSSVWFCMDVWVHQFGFNSFVLFQQFWLCMNVWVHQFGFVWTFGFNNFV